MTKHADVELLNWVAKWYQNNMFDHHPNEQNVLQCLIKCLSMLGFYETWSNKLFKHENGYSHHRMIDHVSLWNISCLDRKVPHWSVIYVLFTCLEQYTESTTSKTFLTSILREQFCRHCTTVNFSTTDDDKLTY